MHILRLPFWDGLGCGGRLLDGWMGSMHEMVV